MTALNFYREKAPNLVEYITNKKLSNTTNLSVCSATHSRFPSNSINYVKSLEKLKELYIHTHNHSFTNNIFINGIFSKLSR